MDSTPQRSLNPIALATVLLLLAVTYLGGIRDGNSLFPGLIVYGGLTLLASVMLYALFFVMLNADNSTSTTTRDTYAKALLATSLLLGLAVAWFTRPEYRSWLLLCDGLFIVMLLIRRLTSNIAFALVLVTGIGMRCIANYQVPFGSGSDMMPLVKSALQIFLGGENPYRVITVHMDNGAYSPGLTYLPVMWLSYLPAHVLGIDLRWTNLGADIVSALLLWAGFNSRVRQNSFMPALLLSIWFLNPYFAHRMDAEIAIFGMMLSVFLYALAVRNYWLLSIATSFMLATMQLALIIVPFAFLLMTARIGLKNSLLRGAVAIALAVLLIAPFYNETMLNSVLLNWQLLYLVGGDWAKNSIANFNFSVFFYMAGAQQRLATVQVLICLAMFMGFIHQKGFKHESATVNFAAVTLLLFLQFNIIVWTYLFLPVFILWSWSIAASFSNGRSERP